MKKAKLAEFSRLFFLDGSGCWRWAGYVAPDGYAYYSNKSAHRYAYKTYCGPIPDGLEIDHLCNVRDCVNPKHLRLATPMENMHARHSNTLARRNAEKTHCKYGHAFTPENTYRQQNEKGGRMCKACVYRRTYAAITRRKAAHLEQGATA